MIPENREQSEQAANTKEQCIQALESYLRQEASYDALSNRYISDSMKKRLAMKAKDWSFKYKANIPENEYATIADEAVKRYMNNWENKTPGEDDRGHRLGKSW